MALKHLFSHEQLYVWKW